jgi:hypothetical protein
MATTLQFRRGTAVEAASYTLADGEFFIDSENKKVYLHDGETLGGFCINELGDLDAINASIATKQNTLVNTQNIKSINGTTLLGSGNITIPGETLTSLTFNSNTLTYTDENGDTHAIDLSAFLDNTNIVTSVNGQVGDVEIEVTAGVSTVNGQAGDVELNVLPNTAQELNAALHNSPLPFTVSGFSENGSLKAVFSSSILNQRILDDVTMQVFGKTLMNRNTYELFVGATPPLTNSFNLMNNQIDRIFGAAQLDISTEVDNLDGTFTYDCTFIKMTIPVSFTDGEVDSYTTVSSQEVNDILNGLDVVRNVNGSMVTIIENSPAYLADLEPLLVDLPCYTKYASIMHLVAASLGDFIN